MNKKLIIGVFALAIACAGTMGVRNILTTSKESNLSVDNVESLTNIEVGLYYKIVTRQCPYPKYKNYTICEKNGSSQNCMPSDC